MGRDEIDILPVVLVGGASTRFGRDKLVEPVGGALLVDHPIAALREATGAAVYVVGDCDARVSARADGVIADPYPGVGPIGGVLAALEFSQRDVVALAGDLPGIDSSAVGLLLDAAAADADAIAVVGRSGDRVHPTIGVYRVGCAEYLRAAMASGRRSLGRAIPEACRVAVEIPACAAVNVNRVGDLPGG